MQRKTIIWLYVPAVCVLGQLLTRLVSGTDLVRLKYGVGFAAFDLIWNLAAAYCAGVAVGWIFCRSLNVK